MNEIRQGDVKLDLKINLIHFLVFIFFKDIL